MKLAVLGLLVLGSLNVFAADKVKNGYTQSLTLGERAIMTVVENELNGFLFGDDMVIAYNGMGEGGFDSGKSFEDNLENGDALQCHSIVVVGDLAYLGCDSAGRAAGAGRVHYVVTAASELDAKRSVLVSATPVEYAKDLVTKYPGLVSAEVISTTKFK